MGKLAPCLQACRKYVSKRDLNPDLVVSLTSPVLPWRKITSSLLMPSPMSLVGQLSSVTNPTCLREAAPSESLRITTVPKFLSSWSGLVPWWWA